MSSLDCFANNVHTLPASFTPPSLPPVTDPMDVNNQAKFDHAAEENSRLAKNRNLHLRNKNEGGASLPVKTTKYRRRRFRKPYYKLSWDERPSEKETQSHASCSHKPSSSNVARVWRSRRDHPFAPYNNNEFLMGEHDDLQESDLKTHPIVASRYHCEDWMPSKSPASAAIWHGYGGPNYHASDDEEYLSKEFSHAYEDIHAERLRGINKSQLVTEYSLLDGRVNRLETRLLDLASGKTETGTDAIAAEKIRIFQEEIQKLEAENARLRTQLLDTTCLCFPLSRSPSPTLSLSAGSHSSGSSSSSDSSESSSSTSSDSESDSQDQISSCSSQCSTCGRVSYPATPDHPARDVTDEVEDDEDVTCTTQIMVLKSPRD